MNLFETLPTTANAEEVTKFTAEAAQLNGSVSSVGFQGSRNIQWETLTPQGKKLRLSVYFARDPQAGEEVYQVYASITTSYGRHLCTEDDFPDGFSAKLALALLLNLARSRNCRESFLLTH